jgi:hypothetical protein
VRSSHEELEESSNSDSPSPLDSRSKSHQHGHSHSHSHSGLVSGILSDSEGSHGTHRSNGSNSTSRVATGMIPKLNLGNLATLAPPPTDSEQLFAQSGSGSNHLQHHGSSNNNHTSGGGGGVTTSNSSSSSSYGGALNSARSGGLSAAMSGSNIASSRGNSISFYQPQSVPLPAVIGAMVTPRTERGDYSGKNDVTPLGMGSAHSSGLHSAGGGGCDTFENEQHLVEDAEVRQAVLVAAAQTALSMQSNRDDFEARRLVLRNCQRLNETHLRKLLTFDPRLATCRITEMAQLAVDGQTPLHAAAGFGNLAALKIFVEMGASDFSLWVRDLQGRTPLHVAAEKGQDEVCCYLREAMRLERKRDPVGENAPTDLAVRKEYNCVFLQCFTVDCWCYAAALHFFKLSNYSNVRTICSCVYLFTCLPAQGTTPLGWATIGSKGKPKKKEIINSLFRPGDRSVLPRTPGKSAHPENYFKNESFCIGLYRRGGSFLPLVNIFYVLAFCLFFSEYKSWEKSLESPFVWLRQEWPRESGLRFQRSQRLDRRHGG